MQQLAQQVSHLLKTGRAAQAVRGVEALLKKNPKDTNLWLLLAQIHGRGTQRYDLTLASAQRAIKLAPKDHRGWLEAAQALDHMERYKAALDHISNAQKLAPKDAQVRMVSAVILANLNHLDRAQSQLRKLLASHPDHREAQVQQALLLVREGKLAEARAAAEKIRETHPDNAVAYSVIGSAGTWDKDDPRLAYLEDTLVPRAKAERSPHLPQLLKTLAKAKNDLEDYDAAITLWGEAKTAEGRTHDNARYDRFVATLEQKITRATYLGNPGNPDETPVLIVGMPRSGSTLLAQILSAHPQVASAGESPALRHTALSFGVRDHDAAAQVKLLSSLGKTDRATFADRYLTQLSEDGGTSARIIDKRLHNFETLALIGATLPKARIIHATRDPMDTCVSCYMQKLPIAHGYTGDLGQLGDYYRMYLRLMTHWKSVLPNPILEMRYEDVVADTEAQARKLITFLGLEWDPACLSFQDNETQVRTLSNWQVRQPIYTSSVQRWRRYDRHLGPLKAALAPLYPDGLD